MNYQCLRHSMIEPTNQRVEPMKLFKMIVLRSGDIAARNLCINERYFSVDIYLPNNYHYKEYGPDINPDCGAYDKPDVDYPVYQAGVVYL